MGRMQNAPLNQVVGLRCANRSIDKYKSEFSQFVGGVSIYGEFSGSGIKVIDDRIDWRDRVLVVSANATTTVNDNFPDIRPGFITADSDPLGHRVLHGEIFCTGLGWDGNLAHPRTEIVSFCQFRNCSTNALSTDFYLYANTLDGTLNIYIPVSGSGIVMITGTEQTGKLLSIP